MRRPKLADHEGFLEQILDDDERAPAKQRHTARRIFERLSEERGFDGGCSTVRDYVRSRRQVRREVFVPLTHPPGHAQADFGEATAVLGGIEQKVRFFVMGRYLRAPLVRATMATPQSDAVFVKAAYHAETEETFCDGHVEAFVRGCARTDGARAPQPRRRASLDPLRQYAPRGRADPRGRHPQAQPPLRGPAIPLCLRGQIQAAGEG
ncbi:MAG: hypothetical protein AAF416_22445 [Pseudomonadota bacterium]